MACCKTVIEEVSQSIKSSRRQADGSLQAELSFSAQLTVFTGHFPKHPLVPAIYLIEAVRQLSALFLEIPNPTDLRLVEVRDARFTGEVLPDMSVEVVLCPRPAGQRVRFEAQFRSDASELARIRIEVAPP